jgi:hypothetical protein
MAAFHFFHFAGSAGLRRQASTSATSPRRAGADPCLSDILNFLNFAAPAARLLDILNFLNFVSFRRRRSRRDRPARARHRRSARPRFATVGGDDRA